MKFDVILETNAGGELDRTECEIPFTDDDEDFEDMVHKTALSAILDWQLRLGDTIRIVEVQS